MNKGIYLQQGLVLLLRNPHLAFSAMELDILPRVGMMEGLLGQVSAFNQGRL
jgi:hypothetical protein